MTDVFTESAICIVIIANIKSLSCTYLIKWSTKIMYVTQRGGGNPCIGGGRYVPQEGPPVLRSWQLPVTLIFDSVRSQGPPSPLPLAMVWSTWNQKRRANLCWTKSEFNKPFMTNRSIYVLVKKCRKSHLYICFHACSFITLLLQFIL